MRTFYTQYTGSFENLDMVGGSDDKVQGGLVCEKNVSNPKSVEGELSNCDSRGNTLRRKEISPTHT